mgnify:CR=1 FL=1
MSETNPVRQRREIIRRLIRTRLVSTQEELRSLLAEEGFDVTQATLSRDLARLGAKRVALPSGGTAYEVDGVEAVEGDEALRSVAGSVLLIDETDALVVVHTPPGAAPAVGLALDQSRLPGVAGTVSGDDTIFIAPKKGVSPDEIAEELRAIWLK